MAYLVEELWQRLGDRSMASLARELGIKRPRLSLILNGKRNVSKWEAKRILAKYPDLRLQVLANMLDEDLEHRDYARQLEAAGLL